MRKCMKCGYETDQFWNCPKCGGMMAEEKQENETINESSAQLDVVPKEKAVKKKEKIKNICIRCGKTVGRFERVAIDEGYICDTCLRDLKLNTAFSSDLIERSSFRQGLSHMTLEQVEGLSTETIQMHEKKQQFVSTHSVGDYALFNDEEEECLVTDKFRLFSDRDDYRLISYDSIVGYELIEDEESVTSGGLGAAAIGALTFGAAGAVVGAVAGKKRTKPICTSLIFRIFTNDEDKPVHDIVFIKGETKKSSLAYKSDKECAEKLASKMQEIVSSKKSVSEPTSEENTRLNQGFSVADELLKFKQLLDMGVLSQEEFDAKKEELLNLK